MDPTRERPAEDQQSRFAARVYEKWAEGAPLTFESALGRMCEEMGHPLVLDVGRVCEADFGKPQDAEMGEEEFVRWWCARVRTHPVPHKQQERAAAAIFDEALGAAEEDALDVDALGGLCAELGLDLEPQELDDAVEGVDPRGSGVLRRDAFVRLWLELSSGVLPPGKLQKRLRRLTAKKRRMRSTDVHRAAWEGDEALVRDFCDEDPRLADAMDESDFADGYYPLHYAAYQGHLGTVELLLERGARPDRPTAGGCTALFLASQQDREAVVSLLLSRGADPTSEEYSPRRFTALDVAGSASILALLRSSDRVRPPSALPEAPRVRASTRGGLAQVRLRVPPSVGNGLSVRHVKLQLWSGADAALRKVLVVPMDAQRGEELVCRLVCGEDVAADEAFFVRAAAVTAAGPGEYSPPSAALAVPPRASPVPAAEEESAPPSAPSARYLRAKEQQRASMERRKAASALLRRREAEERAERTRREGDFRRRRAEQRAAAAAERAERAEAAKAMASEHRRRGEAAQRRRREARAARRGARSAEEAEGEEGEEGEEGDEGDEPCAEFAAYFEADDASETATDESEGEPWGGGAEDLFADVHIEE